VRWTRPEDQIACGVLLQGRSEQAKGCGGVSEDVGSKGYLQREDNGLWISTSTLRLGVDEEDEGHTIPNRPLGRFRSSRRAVTLGRMNVLEVIDWGVGVYVDV